MTLEEYLEAMKNLRDEWYKIAREKTGEAGEAIQNANQLEEFVRELEKGTNKQTTSPLP